MTKNIAAALAYRKLMESPDKRTLDPELVEKVAESPEYSELALRNINDSVSSWQRTYEQQAYNAYLDETYADVAFTLED